MLAAPNLPPSPGMYSTGPLRHARSSSPAPLPDSSRRRGASRRGQRPGWLAARCSSAGAPLRGPGDASRSVRRWRASRSTSSGSAAALGVSRSSRQPVTTARTSATVARSANSAYTRVATWTKGSSMRTHPDSSQAGRSSPSLEKGVVCCRRRVAQLIGVQGVRGSSTQESASLSCAACPACGSRSSALWICSLGSVRS